MKIEYILGMVLAIAVFAGGYYVLSKPMSPNTAARDALGITQPYVEISNPSGFVNSDPITIKQFIGKKVILVDFMTYSCINCQRTFPYVTAWYNKYKDDGLIVIGIHTPEFAFEKDIDNVRMAMKKFGITYPVVLDNDYGTWKAFQNQYWPRKYLIDIHGNIVYDHAGEGAYEETEAKIRELLTERADFLKESLSLQDVTKETPVSVSRAQSPETYFGAFRNEYLGNGTPGRTGKDTYRFPKNPSPNMLYLDGQWDLQKEFASGASPARIRYTYTGKDVYLVASAHVPTVITVLRDGEPVGIFGGSDVKALTSTVRIGEDRLYRLIHDENEGRHTIEIQVTSGTLEAYAFTFG